MERGGRHENGGSNCFQRYQQQQQQQPDRVSPDRGQLKPLITSSLPPRPGTPPLPPSCSPAVVGAGADSVGGFIEHRVSKMDTVAGIAIKYGVEVADIKRINGLVTDLQMFALKSLRIPPGRHPPSPSLTNDLENQGPSWHEQTPPRRRHSDLFETFESLKLKSSSSSSSHQRVTSAMSSLQGYYGLKPPTQKTASEGGFEMMSVYNKGDSHHLEDGPFGSSARMNPPLSRERKCKSVTNNFFSENGEAAADDMAVIEARDGGGGDSDNNKLIRRRQKSEADFSAYAPEKLLKEDNNSSGGGFSAIKGGKGLALRTKAASRTTSGGDAESAFLNPIPIGWADSIIADGLNGVRKSSSASSLQEQQENGGNSTSSSSSSIWPLSKWNLKPDLPAGLSPAAITNSIFDGLPKPITGRRNKAAFD